MIELVGCETLADKGTNRQKKNGLISPSGEIF